MTSELKGPVVAVYMYNRRDEQDGLRTLVEVSFAHMGVMGIHCDWY